MNLDETKIQKLLVTLEEINVLLQRAKLTVDQAERDLKFRLNDKWEIIK